MELKRLSNCGSLKIPNARSGKRRCNGCSPTIASLRRCRTFTTRNSSLNLPGLQIANRSQPTTWRGSRNSILRISVSRKRLRSSKARWSCRRKLRLPDESPTKRKRGHPERSEGPHNRGAEHTQCSEYDSPLHDYGVMKLEQQTAAVPESI